MRRLGIACRRWGFLLVVAGMCLSATFSGCAATKEANEGWAEVWESTKNLMRPDQAGCASPKAVEIDKRMQAQQP